MNSKAVIRHHKHTITLFMAMFVPDSKFQRKFGGNKQNPESLVCDYKVLRWNLAFDSLANIYLTYVPPSCLVWSAFSNRCCREGELKWQQQCSKSKIWGDTGTVTTKEARNKKYINISYLQYLLARNLIF